MRLRKILSEKKSSILKNWFDLIVETYPADTAEFMRKQKNPFADPVGSTIANALKGILEEVVKGGQSGAAADFLDEIIRIRAVQDFTPSRAVGFMFLLKDVIREELKNSSPEENFSEELMMLESRIDGLVGIAFDTYMKCREKIYELKANEARNWTFRLLQKANMVREIHTEG
jgi:hypothetical protein